MTAVLEPPRPARRRSVLITVHLLAALALIGADLAVVALGLAGARGAPAREVYPAMSLLTTRLVVPLALIAVASGVLLTAAGRWGLRHWWLTAKLAITAVLAVVLVTVLVPGLDVAAAAASAPQLPRRPLLAFGPAAASILLTVNALLGRYKPGTRRRRRSVANRSSTPLTTASEETVNR
jgi:hypothetical protein